MTDDTIRAIETVFQFAVTTWRLSMKDEGIRAAEKYFSVAGAIETAWPNLIDAYNIRIGAGGPAPVPSTEQIRFPLLTAAEGCPGHIASDTDKKVCALCGTHVDDERP